VVPEQSVFEAHCTHWPAAPQTGVAVGQFDAATHWTQPSVGLHTRPFGHVPASPHGNTGVFEDVNPFVPPLQPQASSPSADAAIDAAKRPKQAFVFMSHPWIGDRRGRSSEL